MTRKEFAKAYGKFTAYSGGYKFGTYRGDAEGAFESAKAFKPYAPIALTDADFADFKEGFDEMEGLRIQLQVAKRDADAVMKEFFATDEAMKSAQTVVVEASHYTDLSGFTDADREALKDEREGAKAEWEAVRGKLGL